MKSTALTKEASVQSPIEPEKEVICHMETLSIVYRASIKGYSQFKFWPHDFSIYCGAFDFAGHCWSINYFPKVVALARMVVLHIRLLTYTTNSLKVDIQINQIALNGKRLAVVERKQTYFRQNNVVALPFMWKSKLHSSEYVKEDCLSFECIMSTAKWASPEVVKKKQQSAIPSSNSQ